jgi:hypothetical protein
LFYVSSLEMSAEIGFLGMHRVPALERPEGTPERQLLDHQHLSGMEIAARFAVIPLQGRNRGVVFAGYAVEGVSALHLVQALMA